MNVRIAYISRESLEARSANNRHAPRVRLGTAVIVSQEKLLVNVFLAIVPRNRYESKPLVHDTVAARYAV